MFGFEWRATYFGSFRLLGMPSEFEPHWKRRYRMFFTQNLCTTSKHPSEAYQNGRCCLQCNQLLAKSHVELEDNYGDTNIFFWQYCALSLQDNKKPSTEKYWDWELSNDTKPIWVCTASPWQVNLAWSTKLEDHIQVGSSLTGQIYCRCEVQKKSWKMNTMHFTRAPSRSTWTLRLMHISRLRFVYCLKFSLLEIQTTWHNRCWLHAIV